VYHFGIKEVMTINPITADPDILAAEVVQLMQSKKINGLFATDSVGHVVGALNMHDLLREGIV